jgi:DNA-binding GntR family transcriptional regulator
VVELESIDLLSILDLSEVLYQQVMLLAIGVASDEEIAELRQKLDEVERAVGERGLPDSLRAFLLKFVALSHNALLSAMASYLIETQMAIVRASIARTLELSESMGEGFRDYRGPIIDAIENRDPKAGREAVTAYIARGRELVRKYDLVREELVRDRERG